MQDRDIERLVEMRLENMSLNEELGHAMQVGREQRVRCLKDAKGQQHHPLHFF